MKRKISTIIIAVILMVTGHSSMAQMSAMDFNKMDCNGTSMRHLFADLDSGKAVLLHFFMPNCGMCPPPAQTLQRMANNINDMHPGLVKGYAIPFNNTTTCSYSASWVTSNGLSPFYTPMDSGALQVANYGGFGMPTVVVLGGMDHRIMYVSQAFSNSDTSAIRDSIMTLMMNTTAINELPKNVSAFSVFPNPASGNISINLTLTTSSIVSMDICDVTGKQIAVISKDQNVNGQFSNSFNTLSLPNGLYVINARVDGKTVSQKMTVRN